MKSGRVNILFAAFERQGPRESTANLALMKAVRAGGNGVSLLGRQGEAFSSVAAKLGIRTSTMQVGEGDPEFLFAQKESQRQVGNLLRVTNPTSVVIFGTWGLDWLAEQCWDLDIPVLCVIADPDPFIRLLQRGPSFLKTLSAVATRTIRCRDVLKDHLDGTPVFTLPEGIESSQLDESESQPDEKRLLPNSLSIGIVGPVETNGRLADFLECARLVLDRGLSCLFVILSDRISEDFGDLKAHVAASSVLRGSLCWMRIGSSNSSLLRIFDLALAAPGDEDSFCNEALPWMSAGVPVLAFRSAATEDMIEDGVNGFLVEPGQPENLARKIVQIASDPSALARISGAALRTVRTGFILEDLADRLVSEVKAASAKRFQHQRH